VSVPGWVGQIALWIVVAIIAVFLFQQIVLPLLHEIS
jgi:hypothetical protein